MPVRGGMVELTPSRGSKLTLILNKEPDRTLGVGGWASSERKLRRPAKWWQAIPDDTISFDCTLDIDAIGGPSIERRLEVLRDMGLAGNFDEPPTITLDGDVWENDKTINWIFQPGGLTTGPRLYEPDGSWRRIQVGIDLERHSPLSEIAPTKATSSRSARGTQRRRTIRTRGNDTLRGVALRELGDATRWKDLQRWNKKTLKSVDPDARLRTGSQITVR